MRTTEEPSGRAPLHGMTQVWRDSEGTTGDSVSTGSLAPGTRIGPYELIRELGRGGMGAVYLARDTKLGRRVAIKLLHQADTEQTARFIMEARTTARCNHENIVVIHEVGEHHGQPFMVLEYLQGQSLRELLAAEHTLPWARAVELMIPVARALERAHEHNIVHRDLKPDNIFVTESGTVKVLDFGIAKLTRIEPGTECEGLHDVAAYLLATPGESEEVTGDAPALTRQGMLIGTISYMSPEQWGADTVDHRTDIWAIGIILFRMLTGQHPLAPLRGRELMITGLLERPMPSIRQACPDAHAVPDELAALIDRCLRKQKDQRIGSARELVDALERIQNGRNTLGMDRDAHPYAGLSAFQESDAHRFFGRSREVAAAVARMRSQPLLGVVGPSGTGKSSFVRAGLVPALKRSGEPWATLIVRPGRDPMGALAQLVASMHGRNATDAEGDITQLGAIRERLEREPGYLGAVLRSHARRHGQTLLVFVDQLEELYTLVPDTGTRQAFTACLASVADDASTPLRVVLAIRSDFLDRVVEDPYFLAELAQGLFFLSPPMRAGLRDALVQPAEMAGYRFEHSDMLDEMLDYLEHTPGALPLLQFAAAKLWELRDRERRLLTLASYRAIGGIAGALASHADAVLAQLPREAQSLARALFLRLVTPERTRAIVSTAELGELAANAGEVQRLIEHLVHARLVVVQTGDSHAAASIEIVHESLIHGWPLLRRWLDDNQDDAAFLEELRAASRQWHARGRPAGLLWRGEAMEEAQRWYRRYRGTLPELQKAYLQAVFALAARQTRRLRMILASAMMALVLVATAAIAGLVVIRQANRESAKTAQAARVAEHEARAQLTRVQAEQAARIQAQAEQRMTLRKLEAAIEELTHTRNSLARSNTELLQALARAKRVTRRARSAERAAHESAAAERRAKDQALLAWEEMRNRLVDAEKQLGVLRTRVNGLIQELDLH